MKKSTLITTIAMIVVVVVALSTATYAWFSSATTTSASDSITTVAASEWVIMGGSASHTGSVDDVTYSSSKSIDLTMLDGLYSPNAVLNGVLDSASNSATFNAQQFFTATQSGTGLKTTAEAKDVPTIDPLGSTDDGKVSAVNYVRIIRTGSAASNLVLTITVVVEGTNDSDFYAANGFNTYISWYSAAEITTGVHTASANTSYYYGSVDTTATTGSGDGYYTATINSTTPVAESGVTYTVLADDTTIDHNNVGSRAGTRADPRTGYATLDADNTITIGTTVLNSGRYYQIKVPIATSMAQNSAVNIAFYAWFDGWAIDNTGSNSGATVYYEFGNS